MRITQYRPTFSAYDQTLISVKYILLGKDVHQSRAGKFESGRESLRVGGRVREWEGEFESGRVCLICKMEFESGM